MLREWTAAGYVTRDYRLLEQPALTAPVPAPEPVPAAEPAPEPAPTATAAPAQAVAVAPTAVDSEPAQSVPSPADKAQASSVQRVSINRASAARISLLKGVGDKVAASIVAHRPYRSLDDLLRAKGIGVKRLEQLRAQLEL